MLFRNDQPSLLNFDCYFRPEEENDHMLNEPILIDESLDESIYNLTGTVEW